MRYVVIDVAPWLVLGYWFLVTLMYCGQTAGRIEMKFGMEVHLVTSNFVSDGGPIAPHGRGLRPPPQIWPMSTVAKRLDGSR